jgi:cell division protein FtsN
MAVERYGSKTDVVVKLVLVFFIALLSFSIGTFVGKKFSDNQHKLAQLEPTEHESVSDQQTEGHDREIASIDHDQIEAKPNEALSDDDIAKLAEEFVADDESGEAAESHGDGHKEAQGKTQTKHDKTEGHEDEHGAPAGHDRKTASNPSHAAERVAHGKTPSDLHGQQKGAGKALPTSLPSAISSSAIGKFTVQLASYAEESEAQKRAAELSAQGFSAFYVSAAVKGKTWYRVCVGRYATQREAIADKDQLVARAKVTSAIIQRISALQ